MDDKLGIKRHSNRQARARQAYRRTGTWIDKLGLGRYMDR
jgi:hypothetical protein